MNTTNSRRLTAISAGRRTLLRLIWAIDSRTITPTSATIHPTFHWLLRRSSSALAAVLSGSSFESARLTR